uniref:SH3 domain-containing protein n=1 Tax=Podarcis muralis TaxID=64176 RepID=A0A670J2E9_PODMU
MEAVAQYDFQPRNWDELRFRRGDVLKVLERDSEPRWANAERDGREGLIPENRIAFKPHPWFWGKLPRDIADEALARQSFDGAFMIRESESAPGGFSALGTRPTCGRSLTSGLKWRASWASDVEMSFGSWTIRTPTGGKEPAKGGGACCPTTSWPQ